MSSGDFVSGTGLLREIRMAFPHAHITLLASLGTSAVMSEKCPYVNKILSLGQYTGNLRNSIDAIRWAMDYSKKNLWQQRYKYAFYLKHTNLMLPEQFLIYLSGAKKRAQYMSGAINILSDVPQLKKDDPYCNFLNYPLRYPKKIFHAVDQHFYIAKALGLRIHFNNLEMWYNYSDLYQARKLLQRFEKGRIKIIAGIGTSSKPRKYPIEKYLVVFRKIIESGGVIVVIGGTNEIKNAKFLEENLPSGTVLNLTEISVGWRVEAAIMSESDMYIGNFTGACDVAAALHLPVIAPIRDAQSQPRKFAVKTQYYGNFPYQTNTIILRPKYPLGDCANSLNNFCWSTCQHNEAHCITQIKPEEIVSAYDKMVDFIKTTKGMGGFPLIRNSNAVSVSHSISAFKRRKNFIFNNTEHQKPTQLNSGGLYCLEKDGDHWIIKSETFQS